MAVEFTRYETEQRAADALFNELRHYLGHGPGYDAGSDEAPVADTVAERTATAPFVIMLAGGSTPIEVYREVAAHPPRPVHPAAYLLLSDDRYVPAADERSNYGNIVPMAQELGLPEERFVHVDATRPLDDAVTDFGERIHGLGRRGAIFGLGVLGIGTDGHTASLFSPEMVPEAGAGATSPGSSAPASPTPGTGDGALLADPRTPAALNTGTHGGVPRISVSAAVLLSFRKLIFFATGASKRDILYELSRRPEEYPAGRIMLQHPNAHIWTDEGPRVR